MKLPILLSLAGSLLTGMAGAQGVHERKPAGLVDTAVQTVRPKASLQGEGPFTVLAPSDAAFAKIDQHVLASLLEEKNRDQLIAILQAHVVPAKVTVRDAIVAQEASTVGGEVLRFSIRDGRVEVNGAKILKTDLKAKNGIVHVIDTVLIPR